MVVSHAGNWLIASLEQKNRLLLEILTKMLEFYPISQMGYFENDRTSLSRLSDKRTGVKRYHIIECWRAHSNRCDLTVSVGVSILHDTIRLHAKECGLTPNSFYLPDKRELEYYHFIPFGKKAHGVIPDFGDIVYWCDSNWFLRELCMRSSTTDDIRDPHRFHPEKILMRPETPRSMKEARIRKIESKIRHIERVKELYRFFKDSRGSRLDHLEAFLINSKLSDEVIDLMRQLGF